MTPPKVESSVPGPVRAGSWLLLFAGAVAIGVMMLHISADVILRQLWGTPIVGTLEYVTYFYMVAVVFLPLANAQEHKAHVIVEVISNLLPKRVNLWVDCAAQLFTFGYVAFIAWWGWQETVRSFTRNEVVTIVQTDVPLWPTRLLVPLGLGAMAVVIVLQLVASIRRGEIVSSPDGVSH